LSEDLATAVTSLYIVKVFNMDLAVLVLLRSVDIMMMMMMMWSLLLWPVLYSGISDTCFA